MKFMIPLVLFIASISAWPQVQGDLPVESAETRLVTGQIEDAIKKVSQSIKDAGLDPFIIEREARQFELPVPVIFNAEAFIEDVLSYGLSDIRINRLSFNVLTLRLNFDIELPNIHFSVGDSYAQVTVFGEKLEGAVKGVVDVNRVRVKGQVQVRLSVISGISVRDIRINFTLGNISSRLNINLANRDISGFVNEFLSDRIPQTLVAHRRDLDKLLEIVIRKVIEENL